MKSGRKIMNLRRDRGIWQRDLAAKCNLTPGALSKIEAGINKDLRGKRILTMARILGVPADYILDQDQPYPYVPPERPVVEKPEKVVQRKITQREALYLEAFRKMSKLKRQIAFQLPYLSPEKMLLLWLLVNRDPELKGKEFVVRVKKALQADSPAC